MQPSSLLFALIRHFEGLELAAYKDVAGIWTIGYGTTHYPDGAAVKDGDTCTAAEAEAYLSAHLRGLIDHLSATTPAGITNGQFDSLLDFNYNAGRGAWDTSTLRKEVNADPGNFDLITENFMKWNKAHVDGELVAVAGLTRRRRSEAYLYVTGANHPTFFQ